MHKHAERDSYLRCDECHTCKVCKEWKGNDRFDQTSSICMKCIQRKRIHKCNACNIEKQISLFNPNILEHAIGHNRKAVCIKCQEKGFSPKDTQPHLCEGCGEKGHLKFSSQALKDAKKPGRSNLLLCIDCTSRRKGIEELTNKKDAWKCTCQGNHNSSNLKCKLYPTKAGERRWPGKNKGVTEDDLEFLHRSDLRKKRKTK